MLSAWLLPFGPAESCGWAGDAEATAEAESDVVIVGADGQALSDALVRELRSAAWQTERGNRYRIGDGVPQDYGKAVRWYREAAEGGFARAQNNLGAMYEHGLGVEADPAAAARWYRAAAERGDPRAQHSLGALYREGRGLPRDPAEAARWIRRSAEQGHDAAIADLAALYWEGTGFAPSAEHAYLWWKIAALRGNAEAARHVAEVASRLPADQRAEATRRAENWKARPE